MTQQQKRWDIFCAVVDNFGDIGICWRLSKQLHVEYAINVRLWVDDLASFLKICPHVDVNLTDQIIDGVEVIHWRPDTSWREYGVAPVVIEALACNLPLAYQQLLAEQINKPLWINLEYLSAESWVEECHGLPSPQPHLPLDKYFFFPGFTAATGGLLLERDLIERADQINNDSALQDEFWQSIGVSNWRDYDCKISLFAYDHPQIDSLIEVLANSEEKTLCIIPEGALANQISDLFSTRPYNDKSNNMMYRGNLAVRLLPFLPQNDFDNLLSCCDINFVRGEDSFVRAQWVAKPFIWQIYRQDDNIHLDKLSAFLQAYCNAMPVEVNSATTEFWLNWNRDENLAQSWKKYRANFLQIDEYSAFWRTQLVVNGNLADKLVCFVLNKLIS